MTTKHKPLSLLLVLRDDSENSNFPGFWPIYIIVFTTEGFLEVAIESWPEIRTNNH